MSPGVSESRGRRRRRGRGAGGGLGDVAALLPHILTTLNLAAGFYAIVMSFDGRYERACLALVLAGFFDFFDGRMARLAGSSSRFGVEYDSIADTVSFGVAPAMLAFNAGGFQELGWTGWVMAFIYTTCAALRLARFNISPGRYRGRFEGLASPPAAGMVFSTVLFAGFLQENGIAISVPASLPAFGLAAIGLLMVSPIPYHSFKDIKLGRSYGTIVVVVIGFAVVLSQPAITLFLIAVAYTASGPVDWYLRRRSGRQLEEIEPAQGDAGAAESSEVPSHE